MIMQIKLIGGACTSISPSPKLMKRWEFFHVSGPRKDHGEDFSGFSLCEHWSEIPFWHATTESIEVGTCFRLRSANELARPEREIDELLCLIASFNHPIVQETLWKLLYLPTKFSHSSSSQCCTHSTIWSFWLATNSDRLSFRFHIFACYLAFALIPITDLQKLDRVLKIRWMVIYSLRPILLWGPKILTVSITRYLMW